MSRETRARPRRPVGGWILLIIAFCTVIIGGLILITTAIGVAHADVRGMRLEGWLEALFLAGLGVAVAGAAAAMVGLRRNRAWGALVLAAVWPWFGFVTLTLDRITPAPGPGRPLLFYLFWIGLLPAAVTLLIRHLSK